MAPENTNRDSLLEIPLAEREKLIQQKALVADPRRWRPRWFDGRFLAASDLQAEQNYFLIRQADIGRAGGAGVVEGLTVSRVVDGGTNAEKLKIEAGFGMTDTGELVRLLESLEVEPANVPEMQRLDAAFQLQVLTNESGRNRTGLYVLALRPVEWTANPISAYPTSLTGTRTVEDGTIVEGVAVALIPYPDSSDSEDWNRRRARVARDIFVEGRDHGTNSGVLPLAMVALSGNIVQWVDVFMVRRETGSERPAGMDFGFGARALREAHLLQYQEHLATALHASGDRPFVATAQFDALPPIGQFPAGALNPEALTQRFFPAGIEVSLGFVPEDELPALIEESLLSPPLDLTGGENALDGIGVIVLVPLTRKELGEAREKLPRWDSHPPTLRPAFTQLRVTAKPATLLLGRLTPKAPARLSDEEIAWGEFLRNALNKRLLWFVRQRHLPIPSNIAGFPVKSNHPEFSDRARLAEMIRTDREIGAAFERLRAAGLPETSLLVGRLTETRLLSNPALLKDVLRQAVAGKGKVRSENVLSAVATTMDPNLASGLAKFSEADAKLLKDLNDKSPGTLLNVDKIARELPEKELREFIDKLKTADTPGKVSEAMKAAQPKREKK